MFALWIINQYIRGKLICDSIGELPPIISEDINNSSFNGCACLVQNKTILFLSVIETLMNPVCLSENNQHIFSYN